MTIGIQEQLENSSGLKLKLTINNNHSTMLSVKWGTDYTKISMHKMFLDAPQNIMDSLVCYLKREEPMISPAVKMFISDNLKTTAYKKQNDKSNLEVKGNFYNLKELYDDLNKEYFHNKLELNITWFGKGNERARSKMTFGLYHQTLNLIKINRILDDAQYPIFVIQFVIYHEMLHHTCPAFYDIKGQQQIHTKEFKAQEKLFSHYAIAQKWLRDHQSQFFID